MYKPEARLSLLALFGASLAGCMGDFGTTNDVEGDDNSVINDAVDNDDPAVVMLRSGDEGSRPTRGPGWAPRSAPGRTCRSAPARAYRALSGALGFPMPSGAPTTRRVPSRCRMRSTHCSGS